MNRNHFIKTALLSFAALGLCISEQPAKAFSYHFSENTFESRFCDLRYRGHDKDYAARAAMSRAQIIRETLKTRPDHGLMVLCSQVRTGVMCGKQLGFCE